MQGAEYYTALEVAEILGLNKNTIIHRCKTGHYPGAEKAGASPGNPHGMWLIPKVAIDTPTMFREVATLTRQIAPADLERMLAAAVEPLRAEIAELKVNQADASNLAQTRHHLMMQEIQESRADRKAIEATKRPWWNFWR
jgi:hypothetical protein